MKNRNGGDKFKVAFDLEPGLLIVNLGYFSHSTHWMFSSEYILNKQPVSHPNRVLVRDPTIFSHILRYIWIPVVERL